MEVQLITVIFGAGASFGSGGCIPEAPPLGKDLFTKLLELRGAFSQLSNQQKNAFLEQGFESGMATVSNDSRQINPLQKELACYLSKFCVRPDNAYVRFFNKIASVCGAVSIATLNYDLLIEQALAHNKISFNYGNEKTSVSLMKIHGSSNFLPDLGGMTMSGNVMINSGTFVDGLRTNAVSSAAEVEAWCHDPKNCDISPVLAMYEKGKRIVVNRTLMNGLQKNYSDAVHQSSHIVVVGTRYMVHDQHVWNPIERSQANVLIVDPYPEATLDWIRGFKQEGLAVVAKSFDQAVWEIAKYVRYAAYSK
jgi:hypothetical protein